MRVCFGLLACWLLGCGGEPAATGGPGGTGGGGAGGEGGALPALEVEAGFVDLPGGAARMFYSFRPADAGAEDAPLLVFFNGGPGFATTGLLLPYGTGPMSLAREGAVGDAAVANPTSFTRFANLLYVDSRGAGFSYGTGNGAVKCHYGDDDPAGDAADFVDVVLEVLDSHPALVDNPVVLVAESYGGTRAAEMLFAFQHYAVPPEGSPDAFPDLAKVAPWLRDRMQAHLELAFPEWAGVDVAPDDVARQFGYQVLIQPSVFGEEQAQFQDPFMKADPVFAAYWQNQSLFDQYDVRLSPEEGQLLDDRAAAAMRDPATLESLLGVSPSSIAGLSAAERGDARRDLSVDEFHEVSLLEVTLRQSLGEVGPRDAYWLPITHTCGWFLANPQAVSAFGETLNRSHTFITNARYDSVVYSPAIPLFLAARTKATVEVDKASPDGAARPGVIRIDGDVLHTEIRFPSYESGHMVSISAGAELAEDVEAWLVASGNGAPAP